jgi:hypothetical protein
LTLTSYHTSIDTVAPTRSLASFGTILEAGQVF